VDFWKRHGWKAAVLVAIAAVAVVTAWRLERQTRVDWLERPRPAASFALTDMNGNPVSLADSRGKVRLVYFFFSYCPDVCPESTYRLKGIQQSLREKGWLGRDVVILSISFDPERDTPERLRAFAGPFQPEPGGWFFLTGRDERQMAELARSYMVSVTKSPEGSFAHTNLYLLVDRRDMIRTYFLVDRDFRDSDLIAAVKALVKESA